MNTNSRNLILIYDLLQDILNNLGPSLIFKHKFYKDEILKELIFMLLGHGPLFNIIFENILKY